MATCNIRNIEADLLQRVKMAAVRDKMTMREWVIVAFERELHREHMELSHRGMMASKPVINEGDAFTTEIPEFEGPYRAGRPITLHAESCKCFICKPPK